MNNSNNIWKFSIIVFLLIFSQGCTEMPMINSEDTIIPPNNNRIPVEGLWEIKDFISISNENSINAEDADTDDWIGEKAAFTESMAVLANEQCPDAQYKIRSINSREYFLFHYGVNAKDLEVNELEIDIISVSYQNKPFYEFIQTAKDRLMVHAYGGFYILDKVSDTVDDIYIDNSIRTEEKRQEKGTEQDLLRSGILLGLRSTANISGSEGKSGLRSTYRTLWISSYNRNPHPILEVSDLFVPRRSGFWRIGIKTQKVDEYIQDLLFAYPIAQEFHFEDEETDEINTNAQEGNIAKNIIFVGDDYIALEYSNINNSEIADSRYQVLPLDDVSSDHGIRISDIAGQGRKDTFYESAEAHLISHGMRIPGRLKEIAQEDNFTLARRNGHWILRGRLNYDNNQEDFTIGLSPEGSFINYDELHVSWNSIKENVPAAVDAYTSPNKDILLVVTSSFIEIYAIKSGEIADNPLQRINIREGETVVMAEWATGEYVARWEKSLNQLNPFIVNTQ